MNEFEEQFPLVGQTVRILFGMGAEQEHRGKHWIVEQILEDGSIWCVEKYRRQRRPGGPGPTFVRAYRGEYYVLKEREDRQ